ncbi:MAG: MSMEG_4193 family putative phosphomutase [Caldilineaceae bacterium]|nr:MSMEG_4193 family putative phosphomutase [Caldilineaceae bacterium]
MSSTTTIALLIRHGENDWVGADRLAGRTPGVHLNEKGKEQSAALVQLLAQQPIAAIYSSPLERCMETAQPLASQLGLSVEADAGLIEVDYGDWRGGNLKELSKLPEWKRVQHYPSTFRFPGGETLREVQSRTVSAIEQIRLRHPGQVIALFSHGDVIRTTLAHYLGVPLDLFQRIVVSTASVSVLSVVDDAPNVLGVNYLAALPVFEIKPKDATAQA